MNHYEPEASEPARLLHRPLDEKFVSTPRRLRTPLFIKAVAVLIPLFLVLTVVAFFAARKFGGASRLKRRIIFLWVGGVGLLCAGGVMYLRLYARG